ncbi:MAG TPA: cellulase family glycosylhydrolase [Dermatophilaceae bacterium]
MRKRSRISQLVLVSVLSAPVSAFFASSASAATNQFRGVNWADSRDNFQAGVLYVSGLSSSDTYASALATGTGVMDQFISKLGANAVRMPINEATVSTFWSTYTGAIDAVLAKGKVVLGYWDSAKSNKPPDMNAFWNMWKTVVDKYGSNDNAYFEIFNEPNMYSKNDLATLYTSWLTQFSTVPKSRVILDGTGNAQNVPDMGSVSSLDGCLLAVHDYSFFGSDTWTTESQWVSQFKGEVGSYSDRTVCTEWGGPMSPGSKNGISYGSLDYSQSPTNYFEAYVRGMSSQLRAWNMGSFYWPGLRDGDWYSMMTRSGTGASVQLTVSNQSGLAQLQNAWTGPAPTADAGAGGSGGRGGSDAGAGGTTAGGASGGAGTGGSTSGGRGGVTGTLTSSAGGTSGLGGTLSAGSGGVAGTSASSQAGGSGGRGNADAGNGGAAGNTAGGSGGAIGVGGSSVPGTGGVTIGAGGTTAAAGGSGGGAGGSGSGGAGEGGHSTAGTSTAPTRSSSGCSCEIGQASGTGLGRLGLLLGLLGLATFRRLRQRVWSTAATATGRRKPGTISMTHSGRTHESVPR